MRLRPPQAKFKNEIYDAWAGGVKNVCGVGPTGFGKTVVFSEIIKEHDAPSAVIAHRQELVSQISLALARDEVPHKIVGPKNVIKLCVNNHMNELGRSFYSPHSPCAVAGVDTLIRRRNDLASWSKSVTKWIMDEGHHVLTANKWGSAVEMFPNAVGLGVTATPLRADGKGLGRHADGVYDAMVEGPNMRDLISMGYLTDYRIFAPPSDIDLTNVNIGQGGDYVHEQLRRAVRRSHIVGDIVEHYLRIAPGKLGVTFVPDTETAADVAREYTRRGVPAEVVTAKTPDAQRIEILARFRAKQLLQLVNVDLFGEGFDLPAIEVVSMARPTQSFALYAQQFGRALRLMIETKLMRQWDQYTNEQRLSFIAGSVKPNAIIIDHVGNVAGPRGHNVPDAPRVWSLDARERRAGNNNDDDVIPVTNCTNPECLQVYERIYNACPYCGHKPTPADRSKPEFVDGDLMELDPATLATMRGDVERVDMDPNTYFTRQLQRNVAPWKAKIHVRHHIERQEMQTGLRMSMAWWASYQRSLGRKGSQLDRLFYLTFGVDKLSAQALSKQDAEKLATKINEHLARLAA